MRKTRIEVEIPRIGIVRRPFWFILYSSLLISIIKIVCIIIEMNFNKTTYLFILSDLRKLIVK